jgi:hypothetical protein
LLLQYAKALALLALLLPLSCQDKTSEELDELASEAPPNSNYRWFYMNWGWNGAQKGWFTSHQWNYDTGKKMFIVRD